MSDAEITSGNTFDSRRLTARNRARQAMAAIVGIAIVSTGLNAMAASMPSRAVDSRAGATQTTKVLPNSLNGGVLLGRTQVTPSLSLSLGPLNASEKSSLQTANPQIKYDQVGIGRALTKSQRKIDLASLQWNSTLSGARYATLEFASTDARAARLGIIPASIPKGVSVYVYGTSDSSFYGPFAALELHEASASPGAPYWLPVIEGDTIRLELQAPADVVLDNQTLDVPMISHLVASLRGNPLKDLRDLNRAGACNIDIACTPPSSATWVSRGNSVAKYYLTNSNGDTGACTGTLLNSASSGTPPAYFITANHCINTSSEAASMHLFWFFQRMTCNGANPTAVTETFGATFINGVIANDATLVRLNTTPPAGTVYSGWNSTSITSGDTMVTLHHPRGDVKKYSDGRNQGFAANESTTPNNAASHIRMVWDRGTTEGGSSGSGLFNANGEIIGTLSGGTASCSALTGSDWYGRFDQAYPTLQPWLTPGPSGPPLPQPPPVPPSTELASAVPVSGAVRVGEDIWYRIATAANTTSVTLTLTNLTADADIYVFKDTQSGTPACVSELLNTNNESCTLAITGASTIYIDVYGYQATNYTVTATLTGPTPAPPAFGGGGGGGGGTIGGLLLGLLSLLAIARGTAPDILQQHMRRKAHG